MLKNYLTIAYRNLLRNNAFSIINIVGLSVSMSICLLIIKTITFIYSSDRFHEDGNRIYRITTKVETPPHESFELATSTALFKDELENLTDVGEIVRIWNNFYDFGKVEDRVLPVNGYFADSDFFKVFGFKLKYGNAEDVLTDPHSIVLSNKMSTKFFEEQNPVGKTLHFKDYGDFLVTGVVEDNSYNSHMEFEVIASASSLSIIPSQSEYSSRIFEKWDNVYSTYIYMKLTETGRAAHILHQLPDIFNTNYQSEKNQISFDLQPLFEISPGKKMSNSLGSIHGKNELFLLAIIGFVLILTASFTYNNMSIAKSLTRAKEVGIRKINGARRTQVFFQFITEAIMLALISLNFAYLLLYFLEAVIQKISPELQSYFPQTTNPGIYILFLLFSILLGVSAGFFPAWYISKLNAATVVKGMKVMTKRSVFSPKKIIIVFQFFISLMLSFSIIVIYKQFKFQDTVNLGFDPSKIINVNLEDVDYNIFKNELLKSQDVEDVSAINYLPALGQASKTWIHYDDSPDSIIASFMYQSPNYINNLNLEIVAGRSFETKSGISENGIIINRKLYQQLKHENPIDAIGHTISMDEYGYREIIGVVDDFVLQNIETNPGPLAICVKPSAYKVANIKLSKNANEGRFITFMSNTWKDLEPYTPLTYNYYTSQIDEVQAGIGVTIKLFGIVTLIIILIAIMGLLGIVMYDTETRTKEIGIRKVMGANIILIIWTLSKSFVYLLVIASIIAIPISWWLNGMVLQDLYHRVEVQPTWYILGTIVLLFTGIITIMSQTLKVGLLNPVDTLRDD